MSADELNAFQDDWLPFPCRRSCAHRREISMFVNDEDDDFHLQGSRVRFFTDRGTGLEWLDDLEGFQHEAIAVVDREGLEALDRAGRD